MISLFACRHLQGSIQRSRSNTHTQQKKQDKENGKGQKQQMFACPHLQGSILRSKATSVLALHFSSLSRVFWYLAA